METGVLPDGEKPASGPSGTWFRFERLEVWHQAVQLADLDYEISSRFPEGERYGLTSQLRRAAVSVSANIAEGSGRSTPRDFARFLDQAYGSCMEVVSLAAVARHLDYPSESGYVDVRRSAAAIAAMISGLERSILSEES